MKRVVAGQGTSRSIEEGGPLVIYQEESLISSAAIVVMSLSPCISGETFEK